MTNTPDLTAPEAVKRYDMRGRDDAWMGECENGYYVDYDDYAAISAALEAEKSMHAKTMQLGLQFAADVVVWKARAEAAEAERDALKSKLRNVISHATMGALTDPDASLNAIGVKITEMRNEVFEDIYSERDALKAGLAEAVRLVRILQKAAHNDRYIGQDYPVKAVDTFLARHQKETDT